MAVFKIVNKPYRNIDAVEKTFAYITGNNTFGKKVYAVGGIGIDYSNYQNAISQYKIVKKIWNKTDKRQVSRSSYCVVLVATKLDCRSFCGEEGKNHCKIKKIRKKD